MIRLMPARCAPTTFSLMPPTGSTSPRRLISPVIAVSLRTVRSVISDTSAVNMDVALLEAAGVNAKSGGAVLHDRKRGLHAFAHDLAELAGQDELARARHPRRFNEEDIAADRRPGEPRSDARHARSHCGFAFELRRPDDRGKIATRDPDRAVLAFGNAHRGMAQHLPDLAFETPHAGFARIALNDVAQRLVVDFDLAGFEPVGLRLATDQIAMRDLERLLGGVARERDYFHSVA